jgi:hypothetical protein
MNDLNRHLDTAAERGERIAERAMLIMHFAEFSHNDIDNLLKALASMNAIDTAYVASAIPNGQEALGNAMLTVSYDYWQTKASAEAERQIAEEWDSCRCHGSGCKNCNT